MLNRLLKLVFGGVLLAATVGCGEQADLVEAFDGAPKLAMAASEGARSAAAPANTLARSHDVTLDVAEDALSAAYQAILDACVGLDDCVVLNSSVEAGDYPRAHVRMRLLAQSVSTLNETAAAYGDVVRHQTYAEDLAKPIFDQEERLSMLRQYMTDLKALREEAKNDVNALIRLASEISKTQSQLESAEGRRAHLQLRVDTEMLSYHLVVERQRSAWRPILDALAGFGDQLAAGVASAIRGVAYMLPWLVMLGGLVYLVRWITRRGRRGREA